MEIVTNGVKKTYAITGCDNDVNMISNFIGMLKIHHQFDCIRHKFDVHPIYPPRSWIEYRKMVLRNRQDIIDKLLFTIKYERDEYVFAAPSGYLKYNNRYMIILLGYVTKNNSTSYQYSAKHLEDINVFRQNGIIIAPYIKHSMNFNIDSLDLAPDLKSIVLGFLPMKIFRELSKDFQSDTYDLAFKIKSHSLNRIKCNLHDYHTQSNKSYAVIYDLLCKVNGYNEKYRNIDEYYNIHDIARVDVDLIDLLVFCNKRIQYKVIYDQLMHSYTGIADICTYEDDKSYRKVYDLDIDLTLRVYYQLYVSAVKYERYKYLRFLMVHLIITIFHYVYKWKTIPTSSYLVMLDPIYDYSDQMYEGDQDALFRNIINLVIGEFDDLQRKVFISYLSTHASKYYEMVKSKIMNIFV